MSNNNHPPRWVESIRTGNFDAAQEDLTNAAYERVVGAQVNAECQRITQAAGPYAKYVQNDAIQAVHQAVQAGKVQTPSDLVSTFERAMSRAIDAFKQDVRPGYLRTESEPYTPADQEVRDYITERKQHQQHLKDEGRKIAQTPTK